MKQKAELLAPAGNMESLKAAVAGGCDAVYLGLKSYSARAFAGNFSHEEFLEAISYCHIRNVKIYVTMNTMLFETEIEGIKKEVDFLYENDVDGLLIQDLGLFHYVKTCYPDLDIHCSTQMHIHNLAGVAYMKEEGVKRVVLARETPIEIIQEACKLGVEIEVFVYGAICISYSGQCLMSSIEKHRSANKGMCAQCCRLKYFPQPNKHFKEGDYILSPKDLNVLEQLPQLLDAGVASLKIEGRMKRPEYVWLVTHIFRQAIDAYYNHQEFHLDDKQIEDLLLMFNRGFSLGHIFHQSTKERMSQYRPNHQGIEIGRVLQFKDQKVQVKLSKPLYQHDGLRILNQPTDIGLTAVKIYNEKMKLIKEGHVNEKVWLECHNALNPKPNQPLQKTSDAKLIAEIDRQLFEFTRKIPVTITYEGHVGQPLKMKLKDNNHEINVQSEMICQKAKNAPLTKERVEGNLTKIADLPYVISAIEGHLDDIFIPMSAINETRRNAFEQLNALRSKNHVHLGKKEYQFPLEPSKPLPYQTLIDTELDLGTVPNDTNCYHEGYDDNSIRPVVNENYSKAIPMKDSILSSYCDLASSHQNCIAGMTLNIANSYALAYVLSIPGIVGAIMSCEINEDQLENTINAFEKRYGFKPNIYLYQGGSRTLMYIKDSFVSNPIHEFYDLQGTHYAVEKKKDITEIIETNPSFDIESQYGKYIIVKRKEDYKKVK